MNTDERMVLIADADTNHEDARDGYDAFGYHVSTDGEGVMLQEVEYDWLDDLDDDEIVDKLSMDHPEADRPALAHLVRMARSVRETAEEVEGLLDEAVEAYEAGDVDGVIDALDRCENVETRRGGAAPAALGLRSKLLREETYEEWEERVYRELPRASTRLTFHTPPECGGQIVDVGYASTGDGQVIRWRHDRSSGKNSYEIADADEDYEGDFWNGGPRGLSWGPLDADDVKRYWDV